jgi:nitroreductase
MTRAALPRLFCVPAVVPVGSRSRLGWAAQGFFLEATAMGLGSVYTGGFRPKETQAVLGLPSSEEVLGLFPVGRRM